MAEYIEREHLMKELIHMAKYQRGERQQGILGVVATLKAWKTADVVEVRRGRWLHQRSLTGEIVICSECHTLGSPQWKCCPACTADMRGKNDNRAEN